MASITEKNDEQPNLKLLNPIGAAVSTMAIVGFVADARFS